MNGDGYTVGVTDARPIENARLLLCGTPFVSADVSKRVRPDRVFPGATSILVVCVKYESAAAFANLSSLGVCSDYHSRVKDVLVKLASELPAHQNKILVDSPTLCERSLAVRAGLGFFGKNGLVVSPQYGTRHNIGLMLTDIPCEDLLLRYCDSPTPAKLRSCLPGCDLCIRACPNGALADGKPLDASRCISYLTQKKELSAEEEKLLHGQLYGCDICQNACPFNEKAELEWVNPASLIEMTDGEFMEKFGHTAMMWRGAGMLRRNAGLAAFGYTSPGPSG